MVKNLIFLFIFLNTYQKSWAINGTVSGDMSISYEAFDPRVKAEIVNKKYSLKLTLPKKQLVEVDFTSKKRGNEKKNSQQKDLT